MSLMPFMKALATFLYGRVVFAVLGSLGSILFPTMISISSESIVVTRDVLLYSESAISRDGGKSVWKPFGGNLAKWG